MKTQHDWFSLFLICSITAWCILMGVSCVTPWGPVPPIPMPTIPPIIITTTTTIPPGPACGCSSERVPYTASPTEVILNIQGHNDVRCMLNWDRPHGNCSWLTADMIRDHVRFGPDNKMTFDCFDWGGVRIHYCGYCQPSSESPLVPGNPVTVGNQTLRLVVESRKAAKGSSKEVQMVR